MSAAVSARWPIRFRTHRSAPLILPCSSGLSACSPAAVSSDSGSQARSSPLPAPLMLTRTASSIDGDGFADHVEHVGLAAAGHGVHADGLAALGVPQDQFHRLAGLRDHPDRDRVPDGTVLAEPGRVGRAGVERRVDDRAVDGGGLLADADDELAGQVGAAQLDPAVSQPEDVREGLGDGVGPAQDPADPLGAGGAGEQQFLAEAGRCHRLEVEVAEAELMGDAVPPGFAAGPLGCLVPAGAGRADGLMAAQPPVPCGGPGNVDPRQEVMGPAGRAPGDRCGQPAAGSRSYRCRLDVRQPGMVRVLAAAPDQRGQHRSSARRHRPRDGRGRGRRAAATRPARPAALGAAAAAQPGRAGARPEAAPTPTR